MQAVMMVAGKSTRTYPLTLTRPKPLLPIANRPLIYHSLDQMTGLFDEVILIVGYRQEMIVRELGENYRGMHLVYQEQKQQLGTGHAVLQAKPYIRDKFVAMNGDDLFARSDLEALVGLEYGALVKQVKDPSLYGVFEVDGHHRVKNLVEKPKQFIGNLANIGCYVLQRDFFSELENTPKSERGEIEITSAIAAVSKKTNFYVLPIQGFWLPTGFAWDLLKHQEFLMSKMQQSDIRGFVEEGVTIKGAVTIGEKSFIKSGVYIEGPVFIGDGCTIGPNCYLRPYTAIGNNCRIGQAVEIKSSIIMENCNICHLSYVGDSVMGAGCNLGAGTVTANHRHDDGIVYSIIKGAKVSTERRKMGAILADGVQTGVHTSIYPGRKLWPGILTRPGQIVDKDVISDQFEW
ncbi:NTP transferase domain-containing protein [candidate division KSB1 bacterium]|nr:NTP transferase domain-containing protein [candidate division KSB1 bacterium]